VPGDAVRGDVQPEGGLLRGPNAVVLDAARRVAPNRAPFGDQELGVAQQLGVLRHEPARPDPAAYLFIRAFVTSGMITCFSTGKPSVA